MRNDCAYMLCTGKVFLGERRYLVLRVLALLDEHLTSLGAFLDTHNHVGEVSFRGEPFPKTPVAFHSCVSIQPGNNPR